MNILTDASNVLYNVKFSLVGNNLGNYIIQNNNSVERFMNMLHQLTEFYKEITSRLFNWLRQLKFRLLLF